MITVSSRRYYRIPGAIFAGRPGRFGNPFSAVTYGQNIAVEMFRRWFHSDHADAVYMRKEADMLADDDILECYCVPNQCHAQVIADYVNRKRGLVK